jgi:hypothetical protein
MKHAVALPCKPDHDLVDHEICCLAVFGLIVIWIPCIFPSPNQNPTRATQFLSGALWAKNMELLLAVRGSGPLDNSSPKSEDAPRELSATHTGGTGAQPQSCKAQPDEDRSASRRSIWTASARDAVHEPIPHPG